jgi:hypothetical protein
MRLELAATLIAYAGFAAAFAAARPGRLRLSARARPPLRAAAAIGLVGAAALWPRADGLLLAGLSALMTVSLVASAFVLLEPVAPRIVWPIALLAPLGAGLLLLAG